MRRFFVIALVPTLLLCACQAATPVPATSTAEQVVSVTATQPKINTATLPVPTKTPQPTFTSTPQLTPTPVAFDGAGLLVAYEAQAYPIDRQGQPSGDCVEENGREACKFYIYIGDPTTANPWGMDDLAGRTLGDWQRIEVVRPFDGKYYTLGQALSWLPDGSGVMYVRELGKDGTVIALYDLQSGESRDVATCMTYGGDGLVVSPNGKWAVFRDVSPNQGGWLINIAGGGATYLAANVNNASFDTQSQTMFYLGNQYMVLGSGSAQTMRVPTNKISSTLGNMFEKKYGWSSYYDASLGGLMVNVDLEPLSVDWQERKHALVFFPDDGSPALNLMIFQGVYHPDASWSPDRQRLLVSIAGVTFSAAADQFPVDISQVGQGWSAGVWSREGNFFAAYSIHSGIGVMSSPGDQQIAIYSLDPAPRTYLPSFGMVVGVDIVWEDVPGE